jgi:hypothetical protein
MANEHGNFMDSGFHNDTVWRFGGCVIRLEPGTVAGGGAFTSGGPRIHADANHISVGAMSVAVNSSGNIVVTTDGGIAPITWCVVTPDEALAAIGISSGASHGPTSTVIVLSQADVALNLTTQTDWNKVAGESSNLWISWGSPVVRGVGADSLAQQAIDLYTALEARVAALEGN